MLIAKPKTSKLPIYSTPPLILSTKIRLTLCAKRIYFFDYLITENFLYCSRNEKQTEQQNLVPPRIWIGNKWNHPFKGNERKMKQICFYHTDLPQFYIGICYHLLSNYRYNFIYNYIKRNLDKTKIPKYVIHMSMYK